MKLNAPQIFNTQSVEVPTSKSISNRLLIIKNLAGSGEIKNLSEADDTQVLNRLLTEMPSVMDVGHAGTAFRFLTAYLAIQEGTFELTGSQRLKERPISVLVDALIALGAEITYLGQTGFAPLQIIGKPLNGGSIQISGEISSQFVSALMMIAPLINQGLEIELTGKVVSLPYIEMTASLMDKCGGKVIIKHNRIKILRHDYQFDTVSVEKDWSSIAFWYEMMAIQKQSGLRITGVEKESVQGDAQVMRIFEKLGVSSRFEKDGLHLSYALGKVSEDTPLEFDLVNTPDLAQPLIVTLAVMERTAKITGLSTLKNKETHRGKALKNELAKIGVEIKLDDDTIQLLGSPVLNLENKVIETYQDHRMAMAFAPLACKLNCITIENPDVVTKSYPSYWEELRKVGFTTA